ncbi:MAG: hypothetical protein H7296_02640 [Bacteroidia bacterium]|nr:hypothetical protein [Bacteroidia bacterium]
MLKNVRDSIHYLCVTNGSFATIKLNVIMIDKTLFGVKINGNFIELSWIQQTNPKHFLNLIFKFKKRLGNMV